MRTGLGGATVATAMLLAAGAGGAVAAPAPTEQRHLDWGPCTDLQPRGDEQLECATLTVALDRAQPRGETLDIALSRVPAQGERTDVLLVNPGGPGSPARAWASITAQRLPDDLRQRYDVVSFDPRGVGASTPAVACDPSYFEPVRPDVVPDSYLDQARLLHRAADYARACQQRNGRLLHHMTTVDSAHDIDAVRAALGVEHIDYLGYSYGTYLGGVYATLYPHRLDRLILDSMLDPRKSWYESNLAQSRALDMAAENFFDWIARNHATYGLGTTAEEVAQRYYALRERLERHPIDATIGPTEFDGIFTLVAYTSRYWPRLAGALSAYLVHGDSAALRASHESLGEGPHDDPSYGAYLATQCTDSVWPRDWATWHADAREVHAEAPFLGWNNIWYNAPCKFWEAPSSRWFPIDGSAVSDALLVHATDDGATPVAGAYAMRSRFPNGRLVIEDGGVEHGVALGRNACVDAAVLDYLRSGALPPAGGGAAGADLTCKPAPQPEPEAAAPATARSAATPPSTVAHPAR
ncbi:alpha/beta fold hydrolase [Salinactinospora qingdaonensis]